MQKILLTKHWMERTFRIGNGDEIDLSDWSRFHFGLEYSSSDHSSQEPRLSSIQLVSSDKRAEPFELFNGSLILETLPFKPFKMSVGNQTLDLILLEHGEIRILGEIVRQRSEKRYEITRVTTKILSPEESLEAVIQHVGY